jgi:hypothetical protein
MDLLKISSALDSVLSDFKKIFMPEAFVLLITFLIGSIIYSIVVLIFLYRF